MKDRVYQGICGLLSCGLLLAIGVGAASTRTDPSSTQPANSTQPPSPKLITVHIDTMDVADALRQISAQSGFSVQMVPGHLVKSTRQIVIDADRQPFWTVMTELRDQVDARFAFADSGNQIGLADKQINSLTLMTKHRITDAAVALEVERVIHTRGLGGPDGTNEYCAVQMAAYREPDVLPITFCKVCVPDLAVDENGMSLTPGPGTNLRDPRDIPEYFDIPHNFQISGIFRPQLIFTVPLAAPVGAGRKIALLKGRFAYWISTRADDLQINGDDHLPAAPTPRSLSDGSVVKLFKQQLTGEFRIGITISRDGVDDDAWTLRRALADNFRFNTRDGDGIHLLRPTSMTWNAREQTTIYSVHSDPAQTKVSIHIPLQSRKVEQPFEFRDLMLP